MDTLNVPTVLGLAATVPDAHEVSVMPDSSFCDNDDVELLLHPQKPVTLLTDCRGLPVLPW